MKSPTLNQKGSSHIVVALAVVVIAVVAFAGYRVLQNNNADTTSDTTVSTHAAAPNTLNSTNDVRKADRSLDDQSIDGQVNPNKLDDDLNSLL
jgi:hypothetical protein